LRSLSLFDALSSRRAMTDYHCSSRAALIPRVQTGPMLQRHRHSLELAEDYDSSPYVIVNARTNAVYYWGYEGPNITATAVFGVPTVFALLNPGWEHDPWLLLSNC